ncbi:MAG: AtzE family amidohydrolase, partial [Caldimonas sp.]
MTDTAALLAGPAAAISAAIRERTVSVGEMVEASLTRIAASDDVVNAFTDVTAGRARRRAAALDLLLARTDAATEAFPLLGVP